MNLFKNRKNIYVIGYYLECYQYVSKFKILLKPHLFKLLAVCGFASVSASLRFHGEL